MKALVRRFHNMAIQALILVLGFTGTFGVELMGKDEYTALFDSYSKLREQLKQLEKENRILTSYNDEVYDKLQICIEGESQDDNTEIAYNVDDTICPNDFIGYQGNCYWFNMDRLAWNKAQVACIRKGASLASIKSAEEQAFLQYQASTNYGTDGRRMDYYWLGMTTASGGRKVWWDGSSVEYDNFDAGEPQCMHLGCKVAMSETVGYKWEDVTNSLDFFSICKKMSR